MEMLKFENLLRNILVKSVIAVIFILFTSNLIFAEEKQSPKGDGNETVCFPKPKEEYMCLTIPNPPCPARYYSTPNKMVWVDFAGCVYEDNILTCVVYFSQENPGNNLKVIVYPGTYVIVDNSKYMIYSSTYLGSSGDRNLPFDFSFSSSQGVKLKFKLKDEDPLKTKVLYLEYIIGGKRVFHFMPITLQCVRVIR